MNLVLLQKYSQQVACNCVACSVWMQMVNSDGKETGSSQDMVFDNNVSIETTGVITLLIKTISKRYMTYCGHIN